MRRTVVTGMGIVSCLGNGKAAVTDALREGRSGIRFNPAYAEAGMRSQVSGTVPLSEDEMEALIDRKQRRFMGEAAAFAYIAMQEAIEDAGLDGALVSNERTGVVAGSGSGSPWDQVESADVLRDKGVRRVGPYRVSRAMSSSVSACLATAFKIRGFNYSISSACATGAHCIGNAAELIMMGKQDIVFAGGGESEHWSMSHMFDAMNALSTGYNDSPERASRAFDTARDGFVIAGGAGIVVMEELQHALARGAKIYAELSGYGATSDGYDMVAPSGEGGVRAMGLALAGGVGGDRGGSDGGAGSPKNGGGNIDYLNAHGTSTPVGDAVELKAIREVFGDTPPVISSTKSLTGHSLGAAGVQEAIYSLLMQEHGFIAASANIENLDEAAAGLPVALQRQDDVTLGRVMSNSFGFGGTNACLIFDRYAA